MALRFFMRRFVILMIILSFGSCASSGSKSRGIDISSLIRRATHLQVSDEEGFRVARYQISQLRPDLQRVCLTWPLQNRNRLSSSYGRRWGKNHDGLDLHAVRGTPVLAALPGRVIYSGDEVRGYGNLMVIKHARGLHTVYAHLEQRVSLHDQWVNAGELIAYSGASGKVTGPHLHFEIRDGVTALDPLKLLSLATQVGNGNPYCESAANSTAL